MRTSTLAMLRRKRAHRVHAPVVCAAALLLLSLVPASPGLAQTGIIAGEVRDGQSGEPLAGAVVRIDGTDTRTLSNDEGQYRLLAEPGDYTVVASYFGYGDVQAGVTVPADGGLVHHDFSLAPEAIALEELVVEGMRRGQVRAIAQKREATVLMDVISADEIGKLPLQDVGEAVRTLPGVTTTGSYEEGSFSFVSIRGTAARLNNVTIDGATLASGAESRAVGLDLVPATMVSDIEVIKSVMANMDADAIGGIVNIETISPLDRREPFIHGSLGLRYPTNQFEFGDGAVPFRGEVTAGTRLTDNLGLVVSGEIFRNSVTATTETAGNWELFENGGSARFLPDELDGSLERNERRRYSANLGLEYRPAEATELYLNLHHFRRDDALTKFDYGYELDDIADSEASDGTPNSVVFGEGEAGIEMAASSYGIPETFDQEQVSQASAGFETVFGALTWDAQATYSTGSRDRAKVEMSFVPDDEFSGRVDFTNSERPNLVADDPGLVNSPGGYVLDEVSPELDFNDENIYGGETNLRWDTRAGDLPLNLQTGIKYEITDRVVDDNDLGWAALQEIPLSDFATSNPDLTGRVTNLFFAADPQQVEAWFYEHRDDPGLFENIAEPIEQIDGDFDVDEKVLAGYMMGGIEIASLELNAGVRVESYWADILRYDVALPDDGPAQIDRNLHERDAVDFFPSMNFKYYLSDDLILRGAWSNTIARADYEEMSATSELEFEPDVDDPGIFRGQVQEGNPNLRPWHSSNFDLGLEWYNDAGGLVAVTGFYKLLDDPIYELEFTREGVTFRGRQFSELEFSRTQNAGDAYVRGVEVIFSQLLPPPFQYFGITSNVTLMDSEVELERASGIEKIAMFEQPSFLATVIPFFQKGRFALRPSLNYQGGYVDDIGETRAEDDYVAERLLIDFAASYDISRNLTLALMGRNLTNESVNTIYMGEPDRVTESWTVGRELIMQLSAMF